MASIILCDIIESFDPWEISHFSEKWSPPDNGYDLDICKEKVLECIIFFAGAYVLQVKATDADDPTYGNSARVVYSILQGQPYFSIDPKTGKFFIRDSIIIAPSNI